jgi:hypothetical protein
MVAGKVLEVRAAVVRVFAGLLLGLCAGLAQAEVGEALIAPHGEVLNLSSYLQLLEDPGGQLSLEQVQAADFATIRRTRPTSASAIRPGGCVFT